MSVKPDRDFTINTEFQRIPREENREVSELIVMPGTDLRDLVALLKSQTRLSPHKQI